MPEEGQKILSASFESAALPIGVKLLKAGTGGTINKEEPSRKLEGKKGATVTLCLRTFYYAATSENDQLQSFIRSHE